MELDELEEQLKKLINVKDITLFEDELIIVTDYIDAEAFELIESEDFMLKDIRALRNLHAKDNDDTYFEIRFWR